MDPPPRATEGFRRHADTVRGRLRHELVDLELAEIAHGVVSVLDVGGGDGEQAVRWARRGARVTLMDPAHEMRMAARRRLAAEPGDVGERVVIAAGDVDGLAERDGEPFDLVLCHGVLMYLEDSASAVAALLAAARPGGLVSILTKNRDALAMRPGLRGDYRGAIAAFSTDRTPGSLGVVTRGDSVATLAALVAAGGGQVVAWRGVRVLADHLDDAAQLNEAEWEHLLEAERLAGRTDPYRAVAPLIHLIARAP